MAKTAKKVFTQSISKVHKTIATVCCPNCGGEHFICKVRANEEEVFKFLFFMDGSLYTINNNTTQKCSYCGEHFMI